MSAADNVIGGVIIGGKEAYWSIADLLTPADFPNPVTSELFRIFGQIAKSDIDLDVISVGDEAERQGVTTASDVVEYAKNTFSIAYLRSHAELVKSDALARRVKAICAEGAKTGDIATVQASLTALLGAQGASPREVGDILTRMWKGVMERYERGDAFTGIPTGIPLLDEMTGGLQPGRVYGIGARPKVGKTVLAMNICTRIALEGRNVVVWSLEMADEELMQRIIAGVSNVQGAAIAQPNRLEDEDFSRLYAGVERLRKTKLMVCDRTDVTIEQIESQARQLHALGRLDLLCIDYLGLVRMPKMDRHDLSVGHVTRRCKILAKELRIPVLLVFQLNRGSDTGVKVRPPRPSDARDSGSIEQDLDAMILLHRPSLYEKGAPSGLRLDLALQRNGPTGVVKMQEELAYYRYTGGSEWWTDINTGSTDNDL